jgi:hypothetical protein
MRSLSGRRRPLLVAFGLLFAACGSTPTPTIAPETTATMRPTVAATISPVPPTPVPTPTPGPGYFVAAGVTPGWEDEFWALEPPVPLRDGRVMFLKESERYAQIFDPETTTFARTGQFASGSMSLPKGLQLSDGRVLVIDELVDRSVEVWDPATNLFSLVARAPAERSAVQLLPDGRVLFAGGQDVATSRELAQAWVFDPVEATFSPTGPMAYRSRESQSAVLRDGRILIIGGGTQPQIYDPATGSFVATSRMVQAPFPYGTAITLTDGRVFFLDRSGTRSVPEIYDAATDSFAKVTAPMILPARTGESAVLLADGRVLIVGGTARGGPPHYAYLNHGVRNAEIFDPATGRFYSAGNMVSAHEWQSMASLADGRAIVVGGTGSPYSVEFYVPLGMSWEPPVSQPTAARTRRPLPTPTPSPLASGCVGASTESHRLFYAHAAAGLGFTVYCAPLTAKGWGLSTLAGAEYSYWIGGDAGRIFLRYRYSNTKQWVQICQGAIAPTDCAGDTGVLGRARFGPLSGELHSTADGFAIWVAPGTSRAYILVGHNMTQSDVVGFASNLVPVR